MMNKKIFRVHGDVRGGLRNVRDESGAGYILKSHLRGEVRRVGESYGTGPAGHQNFMPRRSLFHISRISGMLFICALLYVKKDSAPRAHFFAPRFFAPIRIGIETPYNIPATAFLLYFHNIQISSLSHTPPSSYPDVLLSRTTLHCVT
jgi:hypothetical protein